MLPIKKIYIDTRFKSSDSKSDSDFKIDLPTTLLMPEDVGFYIDDVCIRHTWYTVETNRNDKLHFSFNAGNIIVSIPEGNYNITSLSAAVATAMNQALSPTVINFTSEYIYIDKEQLQDYSCDNNQQVSNIHRCGAKRDEFSCPRLIHQQSYKELYEQRR